ncbi:MAG: acetate--CoA ligase family protein [Acidobacteriota bacterium]|nr:acetate--CoA ligase family protein [Acidobacteriota bacterium]
MTARLSDRQIREIDAVMADAMAEGRERLLEPEVYRILQALGLQVPTWLFLREPDALQPGMLAEFGTERLVLKVVSSDIAHKTRVGGVRIVLRDRERIRGAMRRMREEVEAHPHFAGATPRIEGFLLTSFVEYSKDLGNEVLIGAKVSMAFGPVISFSKGGTDAEHFAKYFSAPNVRLLPLEEAACRELLETTAIARKYREEGNSGHIDLIAEAICAISALFEHYSSLNPAPPRLLLSEFEVNPFVVDHQGELVAIDGLAQVFSAEQRLDLLSGPRPEGLDALFWPEGIAVVGVSATDTTKTGNNIATLLHNLGREDLYLVNVKGGRAVIGGKSYPLHKSLKAIGKPVDLVVVCVPAPLAPAVAEEARKIGARGLVLIPGGFSEVQTGATLERQILDVVAGSGMRIVGPNCLGIFRAPVKDRPGLNTLFIPEEKLEYRPRKQSNVALLTQSGALGVSELDKLKSAIYPRVVVSYGNQLDVDPGDLVAYFDRDPAIDVIGVYIEGFKPSGGRKFFDAVRRSAKPVIVYKAGRTDAGSRAAASHTASMTGDYKVALAAMEQAGAIVADHILDHKDLLKTFSLMGGKKIGGRRVAGVVNAGFESTYAADNIGRLELAEFSGATARQLRQALPPFVSVQPFLDLTPMADDATFERCIELTLEDPGVHALFISVVPHTVALHTKPEEMERDRENLAIRIVRQAGRHDKPVVVSVNAGTMYNAFVEALEEGGVPTFTTAERAMTALGRLVDHRLQRMDVQAE